MSTQSIQLEFSKTLVFKRTSKVKGIMIDPKSPLAKVSQDERGTPVQWSDNRDYIVDDEGNEVLISIENMVMIFNMLKASHKEIRSHLDAINDPTAEISTE